MLTPGGGADVPAPPELVVVVRRAGRAVRRRGRYAAAAGCCATTAGKRVRGARQCHHGKAWKYQLADPQVRSLSSACGVSCRAGAKRACASRGFTAELAPGILGPPLRGFLVPANSALRQYTYCCGGCACCLVTATLRTYRCFAAPRQLPSPSTTDAGERRSPLTSLRDAPHDAPKSRPARCSPVFWRRSPSRPVAGPAS